MTIRTPVTRAFLPPFEELVGLLQAVWDSGQLTNNGPLLKQLEAELLPYHGTKHVLLASNGTVTLQLALRALGITGEVITTPFSYVASTTAIIWERCTPVFVDIEQDGFNIDADRIERAITPRTQAILATHVYGLPCNVDAINAIAAKHGLKVIYDAAHAFGTNFRGRPLLSYGDISSCSFHATKIFHMVEGGSLACSDEALHRKLSLMRAFGHVKDEHFEPGINAKNSELHASVGLLVLRHFQDILRRRRSQWLRYADGLREFRIAQVPDETEYNHSYFPVVLESEQVLVRVVDALIHIGIAPRRYFYPALNTLPYVAEGGACPIAESIAERVICLPLFHDLSEEVIDKVIEKVRSNG